jgi:hypothetical protein
MRIDSPVEICCHSGAVSEGCLAPHLLPPPDRVLILIHQQELVLSKDHQTFKARVLRLHDNLSQHPSTYTHDLDAVPKHHSQELRDGSLLRS